MPRKRELQNKREVRSWNTRQIWRMHELIDEAKLLQIKVDWREHLVELGHSLNAVRSMASMLYRQRREAASREEMKLLRKLADALPDDDRQTRERAAIVREATGKVTTSFARPTPMSTLMADVELRGRIEQLGPTGGLLGDPVPGRSALDLKRMGLSEPILGPRSTMPRSRETPRKYKQVASARKIARPEVACE